MIKNEYRRGLIILRPVVRGYSGHVRLERRTLMGSMYFIVNAPDEQGELRAFLAGRKNGEYYAAEAGLLRRDGRGQATLAYEFDPRSIDGRALEEYIFVVIARQEDCGCTLVLSGNVDGSREADFDRVQEAVCAQFMQDCGPAWDISEDQSKKPERDIPREKPIHETKPALPPECPQWQGQRTHERDPQAGTQQPAGCTDDCAGNADEGYAEDFAGGHSAGMSGYTYDDAYQEDIADFLHIAEERFSQGYSAETALEDDAVPAVAEAIPVAADSLEEIDVSIPWSAAIEGIRGYFSSLPREKVAFDDDFVYVRAPMPEGSGFNDVLIGIEVDDGRIEAVRFALPGRFSDVPPAGLDNYIWMGGPAEGWWVLTVDPQTGNPIDFDD